VQKVDGGGDRAVRAVIFDMDNTLLEFVEAQIEACRCVVKHLGCGREMELIDYFLRGIHGVEAHENIADYMRDKGVYGEGRFRECCRIYDEVKLRSIEPYPGVRETLETLRGRGLKLAVVTDAHNGNATARLRKTGLLHLLDIVVSADMAGRKKPNPDSIKLALKKLGVKAEEAVLVGDSLRRDIAAGKQLGMLTVYAAYGDKNFYEKRETKADHTLTDIKDLTTLIR
jgi:putative hydrolase of the HAD superfamily